MDHRIEQCQQRAHRGHEGDLRRFAVGAQALQQLFPRAPHGILLEHVIRFLIEPCPFGAQPHVHAAIRQALARMNHVG